MPFGPCNAPVTFQHAMNEVFSDMIGNGAYIYIDDLTIYSKTFEEHIVLLREALCCLHKHCLHLQPKKCTFAAPEVELLGHVIGKEGVKPAPSKIEAVKNYPPPTSKTELRAFLGLIGYYRNFVKNCSSVIEPISRMLRDDVKFQWKEEEQKTFDHIKDLLTGPNILARPDFSQPFILQTDGSALGLGAVLSQNLEGKERLIAFASRRTSRTEANYGSTQIEMLAMVWAVKKFHHYLAGRPFRLITDHSALKTLFNMENPSALFARWIMRLTPYEIDVVIKPGRLHGNADALSRTPHRTTQTTHPYFIERLPKRGPFLKKRKLES